MQEAREAELQAFQPASRETEADRSGDLKSLQRKLDRVLYLLVKKPRKEHAWQMPQGGLEEQESLIEVHKSIYSSTIIVTMHACVCLRLMSIAANNVIPLISGSRMCYLIKVNTFKMWKSYILFVRRQTVEELQIM